MEGVRESPETVPSLSEAPGEEAGQHRGIQGNGESLDLFVVRCDEPRMVQVERGMAQTKAMRWLLLAVFLLSCNGTPEKTQAVIEIGYFIGDTVEIIVYCGDSPGCRGVIRQMYDERVFVDVPDSCTAEGFHYQDGWFQYWHVKPLRWNLWHDTVSAGIRGGPNEVM